MKRTLLALPVHEKSAFVKYLAAFSCFLIFLLASPVMTSAQAPGTVRGKVTNENGLPLEGVSVTEEGSGSGTTTKPDGTYIVKVNGANPVILFTYTGYAQQKMPATGNTVSVSLHAEYKSLNDVVVVPYGTARKSTLTTSVASVTANDFKGQSVTRLDQALQGRSAGVQVTNASGAPGGDVRIRVRGANSVNGGNDPLYVIDGFIGGDFGGLGPDDVESLQILKDASATAAYGSRGSNGVIIITTKKGSKGRNDFGVTARLSSSSIIKTMNKLNAADFAGVVNDHATSVGASPVFTEQQIAGYKASGGTDWQKALFNDATGQQYMMHFGGGTEKTTYYIGGTYQNQPGIVNNSYYRFYNLRSNVNIQLSPKASTWINFNGTVKSAQNNGIIGGAYNAVVQAVAWSPTLPVRDTAGNYTRSDLYGSIAPNPIALTTDNLSKSQTYGANLTGGVMYNFFPGLSFSVAYGVNYVGSDNQNFVSTYISSTSNAGRSTNTELNLQNTNTLNFKHTFSGGHSIDITAVMEEQQQTDNGFNASINNLIYPEFRYDNLTLGDPSSLGAGVSKWSLFSLFGRANYSFNDRYLFSATIRRDGSSRFRPNNRYSYFPSVSAGWVISKEEFMKQLSVFDQLKLRGSWGLTGNQAVSPYSTFATYTTAPATYDATSHVPGILIDHADNPDLKWETTEQKDIGLDVQVLRGAVAFSVDYFDKTTRDLLFPVNIPGYLGGSSVTRNVGSVRNKGFEFTVDISPFIGHAFNWTSSFNFSVVNNKILHLVKDGQDTIFTSGGAGGGTSVYPEFVMVSGQPMSQIWGIKYLGTWKEKDAALATSFGAAPGDARYADLDGDGKVSATDFTIIGNGLPKYTLGWNNSFSYKGLELNIFFQGVLGFQKLDYLYGAGMTYAGDFRQPVLTDIKDRYVKGVNETSDIPAFSSTGQNYIQSSRFIEKGDFIRLKNLSLSYTIPKTLLRAMSIRVFASASNLITISHYKGLDPESASTGSGNDVQQNIDYGSYPNPRVLTGGVTLNF